MSPEQEQQVCDALVNLGWLENDHALRYRILSMLVVGGSHLLSPIRTDIKVKTQPLVRGVKRPIRWPMCSQGKVARLCSDKTTAFFPATLSAVRGPA